MLTAATLLLFPVTDVVVVIIIVVVVVVMVIVVTMKVMCSSLPCHGLVMLDQIIRRRLLRHAVLLESRFHVRLILDQAVDLEPV